MAQRAKRRSPQARKAPPWVSDDVLARLGTALGDETFVRDARRTPFVWSEGVLRIVDHLGGMLAPSELELPLDELVGHHGLERVALSMLANGTPVGRAQPAVNRFAEHGELEAVPLPELSWDEGVDGAPAERDGAAEELDRLRRERDRLAADVTRLQEKADEKDRKLREERTAHAQTRSELTSLHQKEKNRVAELESRIAAGPDGATLARLAATETEAAERVEEAEGARSAALSTARSAEARARSLERALAAAEAEVRAARDETAKVRAEAARARDAVPTEDDLLRAASHVGASVAARLGEPADGDPLLLEAAAAIARWATTRRPATEAAAVTPPPAADRPPEAPAFDGSEEEIPSFAPPEPAAPVVAAPPARVTVLGGGGLGASAYLVEHGGLRIVLDCGVDSHGRHPPLPAAVDAVIVSHAHADHMGGVPDLLRAQPGCRVYCSKPTKLLMLDQANAVGKFIPGDRVLVRDPGETYRILDGAIELTLSRVAHCLGSCAVRLRFADGLTIVYSGDLGGVRPAHPARGTAAAAGRRARRAAGVDARRPRPQPRLLLRAAAARGRRGGRRGRLRGLPRHERRARPGARRAAGRGHGRGQHPDPARAHVAAGPAGARPLPPGRPRRLAVRRRLPRRRRHPRRRRARGDRRRGRVRDRQRRLRPAGPRAAAWCSPPRRGATAACSSRATRAPTPASARAATCWRWWRTTGA